MLHKVEVLDVAAEGKALCKVDDRVVFVAQAVPGDIIDIQVTKKRSNYYEGQAVAFHKLSPIRVEPFCEYFGTCGGCKWQHMPYEEQLKFKAREVYNNLLRIGKIELPEPFPIIGSEKNRFYRNKLEFTFSNKRWLSPNEMVDPDTHFNKNGLGFHIPGLFDKVVDIHECHLQPEPSNTIRNWVRTYAETHGLEYFDLRAQKGLLRTLLVRTSSTGHVMVVVVFFRNEAQVRQAMLEEMAQQFPQITSLMYVVNEKANDTITDQDVVCFSGADHIMEEMEGIRFKIGPKSFYQTNSAQAHQLYKVTRDFAGLTGTEIVYDLYTGTGTIANFIAAKAKKVIGVEYVPEAIADARVNSALNGIDNTEFYAGDMKDVLNFDFINRHGQPDVMIVDPPRAGMHADVVQTILNAAPDRIVYVSCNSATQARDLHMLDMRYRVIKVQPVDMFPHTHHVENVVLLQRR